MKAKKDKILTASVAAVLSVSMLTAAGNAVNSVLAMMSSFFPEASQASIRLVSTLPSIVNVIVGLLMGKVIGKKIRYKTTFVLGGILVGIVFDRYVKILKRMAIPGALTIQGLGIFLILIAPNVFVVGLGATVSGIGTILISSLCTMYVGESTPKSTIPMATVIVLMMSQAGIFLSSYYIQICERITGARFGTDAESSYAVSSVLYVAVIIAAIAMILAGSKRSKQDAPVNE